MSTITRRIDRWLFVPAPAERLAALRILSGLFATTYVAIRFPAFASLARATPSRFEPVGVLSWLREPLPDWLLYGAIAATILLGVAYTCGAGFRITGAAFALSLLALTTYRSSWGQLLYFENLMVLHILIVGFARSADAVAVDAARVSESDPRYGWPVRLAAVVTVLTYVIAGVAKLRLGGLEWMVGDSLRNHVAYSATRLGVLGGSPSPLARPLVEHGWIFPPLAVATVLLELGAPLALMRRFRRVWVVGIWLFHAGIAALMFVVFPYPLALVAFAPLYDLENAAETVRSRFARRRSAGAVRRSTMPGG